MDYNYQSRLKRLEQIRRLVHEDETHRRFMTVIINSFKESHTTGLDLSAPRFITTEKARNLLRERLHNE